MPPAFARPDGDGGVHIGCVSRDLHRELNAGMTISEDEMDQLAEQWVRMRLGADLEAGRRRLAVLQVLDRIEQVVLEEKNKLK